MQILRLDPAYPMLWRDVDAVQFGVDPPVTLRIDGPWAERLLHRLAQGIPARSYDVVAHVCGAPLTEARALRNVLAPVLAVPTAETPLRVVFAAEPDARTRLRLSEALLDAGLPPVLDRDAPVLQVHAGVAPASGSAALLGSDLAHLPLVFDAGGVSVGPLVIPGRTPCLSCRDGHDRDRDPGWAAVHSQLLSHDPGPVPLRRLAAGADAAAVVLRERDDAERHGASRILRISADGRRTSRSVAFHAECRCRSPRGSGRAVGLRAPIPATSSASAYARPA